MKKIFFTAATLSMLCLANVSCQKESVTENEISGETIISEAKVSYSVNGVVRTVKPGNENETMKIIANLVDLAKEGHDVSFCRGEVSCLQIHTKEVVTYTTSDADDAAKWTKKMSDDGYTVHISFNEKDGVFTCIAYKKD